MFNLSPVPVPDLSGKTILVTGAVRGIGAVLASVLAEKGAEVFAGIIGDPDKESRELLKNTTVIPLDVTRQSDVDQAIRQISKQAGRLDALVNNAGVINPIGRLENLDSDGLLPAFEVNVVGLHRMAVAALPLLRESKGVIVNAGTGAATTPMEGWTAYCCSKAAARMMTRMLALELAGSEVQSFFIGIPPTDTSMQHEIRSAGLNPVSQIDQSDLVSPFVAASVMAWLCGPQAREIDKVCLDVRDEFFTAMMA